MVKKSFRKSLKKSKIMSTPLLNSSGMPNMVLLNVVGISLSGNMEECINNYNAALEQMFSFVSTPGREFVSHASYSDSNIDGGTAYARTSQFIFTAVPGEWIMGPDGPQLTINNNFVVGAP